MNNAKKHKRIKVTAITKANAGKRYAMFEAIHGSTPRMVKKGRAKYADPCGMIRAGGMLLRHIGKEEKAKKLETALDICGQYEQKLKITGRDIGTTGEEFVNYLMETIEDERLEEKWKS
jgi:isocitrate dehydrogenase (NAD+)